MFYEGLLEALLAQSPLRRRVNRSWCSYGILKKGTHNVLDHHANFVVLALEQACKLTRPSGESILRGILPSKPKSWSKFDDLSSGPQSSPRAQPSWTVHQDIGQPLFGNKRGANQIPGYAFSVVVRGLRWRSSTFTCRRTIACKMGTAASKSTRRGLGGSG